MLIGHTAQQAAGRVVSQVLGALSAAIESGEREVMNLESLARAEMERHGATSAFLGYKPHFAATPYPATTCISVNDEIIHAPPSVRTLQEGDLVSIDFACELEGMFADAAITVIVGEGKGHARRLVKHTQEALRRGIAQACAGNTVGHIAAAIQRYATKQGLGIAEGLTGHGIGYELHQEPSVPNVGKPGEGMVLTPGMAICIEPMLTLGTKRVVLRSDGWTLATADGTLAAHCEHTVLITEGEPLILTA